MGNNNENAGWLSRMLSAFAALFNIGGDGAKKSKRSSVQSSSKTRHIAGHWPVWIELSSSTREAHKPREDSIFTLRFSASDAGLLKSLKINAREFTGSYVAEKKRFMVQVPERLVEELMRNLDKPAHVEGYMDGECIGVRRFTIPLSY